MENFLSAFFNPKSIVIIGVSHQQGKVGYEVANNLLQGGFRGEIFFVNPKAGEILGRKVFKSLFEIKKEIDLAIIIVPAQVCSQVLEECAKKNIKQVMIISAGFKEIGKQGERLEEEIKKIIEKYQISLIGPNCLGVLNPWQRLNASFAPLMPEKGNIFLISQSGALLCGLLDQAAKNCLKFSKIVSLGNKLDLNENDFLEYALKDSQTKIILFYLESFADGKRMIEILKNNPAKKPVILLKGGMSERAKKAVASHSGNLAGSKEAFEAFLKKTNIIKADSLQDLINLAKVFSFFCCRDFSVIASSDVIREKRSRTVIANKAKQSRRDCIIESMFIKSLCNNREIAILTNAGGIGVLGIDEIEKLNEINLDQKIEIAQIEKTTKNFLRKNLPSAVSLENPIDILGDARADRYEKSLEILLKDKKISGVVVFLTPQKMTESEETAKVIVSLFKKYKKPILTCFFGQERVERAIEILEKNKIPNFDSPEQAIEMVQKIFQNSLPLRVSMPSKRDNLIDSLMKEEIRRILNFSFCHTCRNDMSYTREKVSLKNQIPALLDIESTSKILKILKIPYPDFAIARSEKEAIIKAKKIRYPLVIKTTCRKIIHKKDINGIKINIKNEKELKRSYQEIVKNVKKITKAEDAEKVIIQKMIDQGEEVIIGMKQDQQFGPLIVFGLGGIFVEVLKDLSFRLAPLTRIEAREMILETKGSKILQGLRGEKVKDIDSLVEILLKIAELSFYFPQIKEIDLNPVRVFERGCSCLDFKFIL